MRYVLSLFVLFALSACSSPQHVGSAVLNMQPAPPTFRSQLDFDLLDRIRGTACAKSDSGYFVTANRATVLYWTDFPLAGSAPGQVRGLIAAAALDAIEKTADADTMIITRVETEAKSADETCAYVYGRGVRIRKASDRTPEQAAPPSPGSDRDDGDDNDDHESGDERH